MMLTNLKLRDRLFVGFSTPVLLVIGFSGLVYSIGNQVAETFKEVNMNNLNQGAIQTASGISETKVGIQKLKEAAQRLQSIV